MAFLTALINKVSGQAATTRVGFDQGNGAKTSVILVDATLSDNVTLEAELTTNPVEKGIGVTDHVIIKPKKIEVEGIVSEAPIQLESAYSEKQLLGQLKDASGGALGAVAQKFGANPIIQGATAAVGGILTNNLFSKSQSPAQETKNALITILEGKNPISIQVGKQSYKDMVLVSLSFPRDPSLGQAVKFRATFQEIRTVSSEEVIVTKKEIAHSAAVTKSLGNQNTSPVDGSISEKASVIYKLDRAAGSTVKNFLGSLF